MCACHHSCIQHVSANTSMSLGNGKHRTQRLGAMYRLGAVRLEDGLRAGGGRQGPVHMVFKLCTIPGALIDSSWASVCSGRSVGCSLRAACCNVTSRSAWRFLRGAISGPRNPNRAERGYCIAFYSQCFSNKLTKEAGVGWHLTCASIRARRFLETLMQL